MAWTTPKTWVVGAILAAAELNTHLRDQLAYLKGVIDGTDVDKIANAAFANNSISGGKLIDGSVLNLQLATGIDGAKVTDATISGAKLVTMPTLVGGLTLNNDAVWLLNKDGTGPFIRFDTGDYMQYERTNNILRLYVADVTALAVDGNGKLTGKGFYDSGEFAIAAGATVGLAPGNPAGEVGPRFVYGLHGLTGNTNLPIDVGGVARSTVRFGSMTSSVINVVNNTAGATYGRVWAIY